MPTLFLALSCLLLICGCGGAGASVGGNSNQLTSSTASASLGNVTVGSTGTQSVTLTNTGTTSLTITQVTVTGAGFSVSGINPPITLPAGQSVTLTVKFTATTTGPVTGTLSIVSSAPGPPVTITLNANAVPPPAPQVTLNPATLNFGNVLVGSTGSQLVTLTNSGTANLSVTQATVSGAAFGINGLTLPLVLTQNQQTTFTVTYSPSAPGAASGSISLVSNASTSPNSLPLAAAGVQPNLSVSPSSISEGSVPVGSSASQTVTLTNTGTAALNVTQATVTGPGFSLINLTIPLSTPPGQSSNLGVLFAPISMGPASGNLTLVSNAPNSPSVIALSGNGMAPTLSVNPTSLAFGNVNVGSSSSLSVTVSNSGNVNLTITQANVTGTGFSTAGLALPLTIPAGQNSSFNVLFAPASSGNVTGSLSLVSNAPGPPTAIPLSGNGVAVAPGLSVNPTSLAFGNVNVGSSRSLGLMVTNSGNASLTITQANVTGAGFSTTGLALPLTIPAGQNSSFNVQFTPASPANVTGSLSLVSNAPNSPTTVALSGSGVALAPAISVNPASLAFGNVNVGSSDSLGVTVSNAGNASLTITQANVTGAGFSTTGLALPLTIPAGQNSSFNVQFAPASAANVTGSLSLVSNAPTSPTVIALSGTGQSNVSHYIYVALDGQLQVFDADNGHGLLKTASLSGISHLLGLSVSVATRSLYISYGGFGGSDGNGSLAKYDLMTDTVVWKKSYTHGVDSIAITPDGSRIYLPAGEASNDPLLYVVDPATGNELGSITVGTSPHNAMMGLDGKQVYLGPRDENFLYVIDTSTNGVVRKIGPLVATNIVSGNGVRPFAVNGKQTLAFTTASGFLGFQVSDINTGNVLYTVTPQGFSWDGTGPSTPCHGISLSPDERELYLIDTVNGYVHVYDVTGLPGSAPQKVASLKMSGLFNTIGWLQHSRDGRFVYVADTGDVIDTATHQTTNNLPLSNALNPSRWYIEIDWSSGVPVFGALSRGGQGYLTQ